MLVQVMALPEPMLIQFSGVSDHQPHDCLLNRLFRRTSKKTSKLRVTGLCAENSPVTGEFPAQMVSNAKKFDDVSRHHDVIDESWGHFTSLWAYIFVAL